MPTKRVIMLCAGLHRRSLYSMDDSYIAATVFLVLLYCLGASRGIDAACTPDFPDQSSVTSAQAAGATGIQVVVPSYNFTCDGVITSVDFRVSSDSGNDSFVFQVWRLRQDGAYHLMYSVDTSGATQRDGNVLTYSGASIPVQEGDTIGYRLEPVTESPQLQLILDHSRDDAVLHFIRNSTVPCQFSVCDTRQSTINAAPFISVEFEETMGEYTGPELQCTSVDVVPCDATTTTTTTDPPSSGTGGGSEEGEGESDALLNLNLTTETVVVLAIGVCLFIVLIILVIVLVACICRRRKPAQYRLKGPPPNNGTIMGTALTSISAYANEHVNGTVSRVGGDNYINSSMQTRLVNGATHSSSNGSLDPLSPPDSHDPDHTHRGQRMKSPLLPKFLHKPTPPSLPPRENGEATSQHLRPAVRAPREIPSPPSKSSVQHSSSSGSAHSGSIPPSALPATVPPPAAIALQLQASATPSSSFASLPPSTTTTFPPPPPITRSPPTSTSAEATPAGTSEFTDHQRHRSTDLKLGGHPYDHLHGNGKKSSRRKNTGSQYIYTYVPTEEQRRLIKLQSTGRYEVTDEMEEVRGYDRLKFFKESETYWSPATTTSGLYAQLYENKYRELPREQIITQEQIGSGHFGSVSKGLWLLRGEGGEVMEGEGVRVAVKVVKTEAEEMQRVKLLQEAAIMGQFAHPNVVRLNGVVTVGDPTMIVLEYMPQGDLKSYLQKLRPSVTKRPVPKDTPKLFVKFGKDIAAGMSYLTRKNFVHRDLATRNILLSHNLTCKIGDFGMARDIAGSGGGSDYYKSHGGIIPVKWTAPESLNYNKYTSASDVWSYGMVLFEIWSLGHKPFPELANPIVIALVTSKHCQAPPPGCSRPIYHLMVECWNPKDTQRPTFDCIQKYLDTADNSLLNWSPGDVLPGRQAHVLGAPLVEGNNLYIELQRTYQTQLLAQMQSSNT